MRAHPRFKGGAWSAENTSEGPDPSVSWHARRMWKNKVNLRVILLLALLAGCVGVYARYDRLRREAIGLPRTDTALHQIGWLASRLSDFSRFGLQRDLDAWTSACVRRAWPGDDCRKRCGGEYRDELGRTAAAIGEVEPAFATLYAPGAESPARLLALRDWFRAEAADDEVWTCTRGGMLEKLDQL